MAGISKFWRLMCTLGIALTTAFFVIACSCSQESAQDGYLIRVGGSTITVLEFKQMVQAASEESFPGEQKIEPSALNDMRMRILNQVTEEMVVIERAKQLGIQVSDTELEASIAAIKADYPDDTFEKTLLENAVSYKAWKKKMATRMLVDKVIASELVNKVEITSEDIGAYFRAHYPEGIPDGEDVDQINSRIVQHLRIQKAEAMYQNWIEKLRKEFPVDIHQQRWNQLSQP